MTTDDGDVRLLWVRTSDGAEEARRAYDIKGGHTKEAGRVKGSSLLEDRCNDGDGAVDGVGDDEDVCLGGGLCDGLSEVADDAGISLSQTS